MSVPWKLGIPDSVIAASTGTSLRDYFTDPRVMLESQRRANAYFERRFGLKRQCSGSATSYLTASTVGLKLVFHDHHEPMPVGARPLEDDRAFASFVPPTDPVRLGLVPSYLAGCRFIEKACGIEPGRKPYTIGFQGPLTTAVLLRGAQMFADLYERPKEAHRLLDLLTDHALRLASQIKTARGASDAPVSAVSVTDDFSGQIGPGQYEQFVLPGLLRLYEAWPGTKRMLHAETLKPGHLGFLQKLGIDEYDPGMDRDLTVTDLVHGAKCFFYWNLKSSADMLQGNPESIRRQVAEAIDAGAPGIMTELTPGIAEENIDAFLSAVRG